jgi:hypothetical protein
MGFARAVVAVARLDLADVLLSRAIGGWQSVAVTSGMCVALAPRTRPSAAHYRMDPR